jgi:hypothetical protein
VGRERRTVRGVRKIIRTGVLWYSVRNRRRKAEDIVAFMQAHGCRSLLLCGSVPESAGDSRNEGIVERTIADHADEVLGFDIVARSQQPWPAIVADGRCMPFDADSYDVVVSNAVIEHVGDREDQQRFVDEHTRVGRSWVITTPNRWFPVESHTSAVLRHWSASWSRGRSEFTRLMSRREFAELLPEGAVIVGRPWSATFTAFYAKDATAR